MILGTLSSDSADGTSPRLDQFCGMDFDGVDNYSICPGSNLAQASIFAFCAMTLAVFDIGKVVENGQEVTPDVSDAVYSEDGVR